MQWQSLPFSRHKGRSLPQVLLTDPGWVLALIKKGGFKHPKLQQQVGYLLPRARAIAIPPEHGATRRRMVEAHTLAQEIRIFEDGELIATHPVLEGHHQRRVALGQRKGTGSAGRRRGSDDDGVIVGRAGDVVAQRSLEFYDAVARRLAQEAHL